MDLLYSNLNNKLISYKVMFKKRAVVYVVVVTLVKSGFINKELVLQMDNKAIENTFDFRR